LAQGSEAASHAAIAALFVALSVLKCSSSS
jgi:hypothetical protein